MGATWQWKQYDNRLSHFDTIPACDGRPAYSYNVRSITDAHEKHQTKHIHH